MATIKGGSILINKETKKIALIYRPSLEDYSFPKGHVEPGEDIKTGAVRETIEETFRNVRLLKDEPIYTNKYVTPAGEDVECYFYLTEDLGEYEGTIDEKDREICQWFDIDEIREKLTYDDLKCFWDEILPDIKQALQ